MQGCGIGVEICREGLKRASQTSCSARRPVFVGRMNDACGRSKMNDLWIGRG